MTGDGSFWMVAQDLETAVREELPVVVVITNNFSFGNIRDRQRADHAERYIGVRYGNPDFAEFARLLGAHGERVERSEDLEPALERALAAGKPAVVDVVQHPDEGLPEGVRPPSRRDEEESMFKKVMALAAIAALAVAGCGGDDDAGGGGGAEASGPRSSWWACPIAPVAPLYLGMKQGFFEDENLKIEPSSSRRRQRCDGGCRRRLGWASPHRVADDRRRQGPR